MREKTVLILACIAVPALALALVMPSPGVSTMEAARPGTKLLPGLAGHLDSLAAISITGSDGKISLSRTPVAGKPAEGWTLRDKGGYPVPAATIKPVIDNLALLHGVAAKTEQPKLYGRLDLTDPGKGSNGHLVAVYGTNGSDLGQVVLGRQKEASGIGSNGGIYARVPGTAATWLAEPQVTLPATALDWIDHTIIDIDADKIKEVAINQPGTQPIDFTRNKAGDKLTLHALPPGQKLKSDTPGSDIEIAFHDLELQDVKPQSQLGTSQTGGIHLATFDGAIIDVSLFKDNGQTWATVATTSTGDSTKIAAKTKGWAYQLPPDRAATMTTKLADLLQTPAQPGK